MQVKRLWHSFLPKVRSALQWQILCPEPKQEQRTIFYDNIMEL